MFYESRCKGVIKNPFTKKVTFFTKETKVFVTFDAKSNQNQLRGALTIPRPKTPAKLAWLGWPCMVSLGLVLYPPLNKNTAFANNEPPSTNQTALKGLVNHKYLVYNHL